MRILITGAGGNLGRAAIPVLAEAGHELRLFDMRPLDTDHESVEGDVRDRHAVAAAMEGVDAVVHGAALHGIHLGRWSHEDFWSINTTGTFIVYDAARTAGVTKCVLASSMAVYGDLGAPEDQWEVVDEQTPRRPTHVYGLTKAVAEDIARFHTDVHGITTVALRLGMFVPERFERYGFRLLFGGVDDRDVGQAVRSAVEHQPAGGFDIFNIMADVGLDAADLSSLNDDVAALLDERWPGTTGLVRDRGLRLDDLMWGRRIYPMSTARHTLGYDPQHGFDAFFDAWRRQDTQYYPSAGLPWWGVDGGASEG